MAFFLTALFQFKVSAASANGDECVEFSAPPPVLQGEWQPAGAGDPMVSIEILPVSGVPVSSPSYLQNRTNTMLDLTGTAVPMDPTTNPADLDRFAYFTWDRMTLSSGFNSWGGTNNPSAPFNGQFGKRIKWCVRIKTTNGIPFSANQVWFNVVSSSSILNLSGNMATNSANPNQIPYQFILQGLNYGPNGVKGGGDDVLYNSDTVPVNCTELVHEAAYFGVTTAFTVSGDPTAALTAARNIATAPGFYASIMYYLKSGSTTNGIGTTTVGTAPKLEVFMAGTNPVVRLLGQPGLLYTMWHTFNLPPSWVSLGIFPPGKAFTNSPTLYPHEFFRASNP